MTTDEADQLDRFVVVGAGTMGIGIGYVAANSGYRVDLVEVDPARARTADTALDGLWGRAVERGRTSADAAEQARDRLSVTTSLGGVAARPQVVVEAVPERLDLKRDVLADAERLEPSLLASNTSSLPIGQLAEALRRPERFCGLHFFNPVWSMALLEVVVGPRTSEPARAAALDVAARLGKDPVVVRDAPGFATSRLGIALGMEAIRMVEDEVASAADIDKAMRLGYRHPVGPLELSDIVGLDVRLDIARALAAAYGDRFAPPKLLERMVADGRLGRKSGQGFYRWVDGEKQP